MYFQKKTGVFVFGVKYPGNAAQAGLAGQDILLKVDGKSSVNTLAELETIHKATVKNVEDKPRILL